MSSARRPKHSLVRLEYSWDSSYGPRVARSQISEEESSSGHMSLRPDPSEYC